MSGNTQCDLLANRFQKKAAEGLVDVKFFLRNTQEASAEQICQEVNNLYDAVERGEWVKLDFKKRRG
jgi:hypothetical protein